ncbi:(2Fe-2S)-binding protein [Pseudomonas sp. GV047]
MPANMPKRLLLACSQPIWGSSIMGVSMFKKLHDAGASTLTLYIDGQAVEAEGGETIAAVLLRQRTPASRTTPVHESPRAPYCMMGVCFDCLVIVDGVASTQSCLVTVQEGMRVERQFGRRSVML